MAELIQVTVMLANGNEFTVKATNIGIVTTGVPMIAIPDSKKVDGEELVCVTPITSTVYVC